MCFPCTLVRLSIACQMVKCWSKIPKTEVLTAPFRLLPAGTAMPGIPLNVRLGIKPLVFASGKRRGVLMPETARVALLSEGAINTPPRPDPKMNSFTRDAPKFLVSESVEMFPGPFFRSVVVSGQFHDAVVVP